MRKHEQSLLVAGMLLLTAHTATIWPEQTLSAVWAFVAAVLLEIFQQTEW